VLKLGNNSIAKRYKNSREATDDASADTSGSVLDPYYDGALDLSSDGVITPVFFFWCLVLARSHLNVLCAENLHTFGEPRLSNDEQEYAARRRLRDTFMSHV
jgi:hypothetical protein